MTKQLNKKLSTMYEEINELWKKVSKDETNVNFIHETKQEIEKKFNLFISEFVKFNKGLSKEVQVEYDKYCGNYFLKKGILEEHLKNYDGALRNYNLSKIFNPFDEEASIYLENLNKMKKDLSKSKEFVEK